MFGFFGFRFFSIGVLLGIAASSLRTETCLDVKEFLKDVLKEEAKILCKENVLHIKKDHRTVKLHLNLKSVVVRQKRDVFDLPSNRRIVNEIVAPKDDGISHFKTPAEGISELEVDLESYTRADEITCETARNMWRLQDSRIRCNSHLFSMVNGACNDVNNKGISMAKRPFKRLLKPDYCDGKLEPRCAESGRDLPNARLVSNALQLHRPRFSTKHSAFFMQWGQYISHDISHTPITCGTDGKPIKCKCSDGLEKKCVNIPIPICDKHIKFKCIPLARSAGTVPLNCQTEVWQEQLNQVTPLIDASTIYGSTYPLNEDLFVSERSAMLKVLPLTDGSRLPPHIKLSAKHGDKFKCPIKNNDDTLFKCFSSGDFRVNETPMLSSTHLLWVRQHNRLAKQLSTINPHWSSLRVRNVARKIVIAQHQIVTYGEYLPEVLGTKFDHNERMHDLRLRSHYLQTFHKEGVDPRASNVFATAAFRFGHSQISNLIGRFGKIKKFFKAPMRKDFFNSSTLYDPNIGPFGLLAGVAASQSMVVSPLMSDSLRNHLFSPNDTVPGMDLFAINIQRGREHGLPSYAKWREYCGLSPVTSLEQACHLMGDYANVLQTLYETVNDIDVYVGGLMEKPVPGGVVGETFACIIAEQFKRLKDGDAFWFENGFAKEQFSIYQLYELRRTSLSQLICDNFPEFEKIQPFAMKLPIGPVNALVNCRDLPRPILHLWRDEFISPRSGFNQNTESARDRSSGPEIPVTIKMFTDSYFNNSIWQDEIFTLDDWVYVEVKLVGHRNFTDKKLSVSNCTAYVTKPVEEDTIVELFVEGCPKSNSTSEIIPVKNQNIFRFKFRLFERKPSTSFGHQWNVFRPPKIKCDVLICSYKPDVDQCYLKYLCNT